MVRTTFMSVNRHTQHVIQGRFNDLAALQQKMATGKQLTRPSDGAIETANTLKLKTQNVQLRQYETNINDGLAWLQITDTAMMSMDSVIRRARELAIQGDTDTLSPTERGYITDEIDQLTRQLIALVNTRYKGDYLFSGSETDKPAVVLKESNSTLDSTINNRMCYIDNPTPPAFGTGLTFQIMDPNPDPSNTTILRPENVRKIIPGSLEIVVNGMNMIENVDYTMDYMTGKITLVDTLGKYDPNTATPHPLNQDFSPGGIYGGNAFQMRLGYMTESKDIYNGNIDTSSRIFRQIEENVAVPINTTLNDLAVDRDVDIFTSLIMLGQSLVYGDHTEINRAIGWLDGSLDKILSAQSVNGSITNRFDTTLERNEYQQVEVTRLQANLEDADYATVVANYAVTQTIFNAALNSTAKIMQTSLADYLR